MVTGACNAENDIDGACRIPLEKIAREDGWRRTGTLTEGSVTDGCWIRMVRFGPAFVSGGGQQKSRLLVSNWPNIQDRSTKRLAIKWRTPRSLCQVP